MVMMVVMMVLAILVLMVFVLMALAVFCMVARVPVVAVVGWMEAVVLCTFTCSFRVRMATMECADGASRLKAWTRALPARSPRVLVAMKAMLVIDGLWRSRRCPLKRRPSHIFLTVGLMVHIHIATYVDTSINFLLTPLW